LPAAAASKLVAGVLLDLEAFGEPTYGRKQQIHCPESDAARPRAEGDERVSNPVVLVTPGDIVRIAAHGDPIVRNLLITNGYHELSAAVRQAVGAGANWCTFATWASKQAGRTIRREDLREALRARLRAAPEIAALAGSAASALRAAGVTGGMRELLDHIVRTVDADTAFERASRAVAEGNLKVFEEIGLEFARFLEALAGGDARALDNFMTALRPGDPPAGQQLLRDAFSAYRSAIADDNGAARSQLMFLGNLLIGMHEQTRLQPQIAAALNAAFDAAAVRRRVVAALLPGMWRAVRYRVAAFFGRRPPLDDVLDRLLPIVQRELRQIVTEHAMVLQLSGGVTVRLGKDVVDAYPTSLAAITHPQLLQLLQRIDPNPHGVAGSGAADWSVLSERMHLITELFRCRHDWEPLFDAPFTASQVEAMRAGRRPADPL
jgi:hypothetical protein